MADVIDFPKNLKQQEHDKFRVLVNEILSEINALELPVFNVNGKFDDTTKRAVEEAVNKLNDEHKERMFEAIKITVDKMYLYGLEK